MVLSYSTTKDLRVLRFLDVAASIVRNATKEWFRLFHSACRLRFFQRFSSSSKSLSKASGKGRKTRSQNRGFCKTSKRRILRRSEPHAAARPAGAASGMHGGKMLIFPGGSYGGKIFSHVSLCYGFYALSTIVSRFFPLPGG